MKLSIIKSDERDKLFKNIEKVALHIIIKL
jgi:hypothetical protein